MERFLEKLDKKYITLENNKYKLKSKYKIGTIEIKKDYALLKPFDNKPQIYIEFDRLNGANENDTVLVQVIFNPKGKVKAKVLEILKHNSSEVLCYVDKNYDLFTIKDNIKLEIKVDKNRLDTNSVVVLKDRQIVKTVGSIDDPMVDEFISLFLYKEEYRLQEYSLDNIPKLSSTNRIDLTELDFCTIDPNDAKDFDDAIYFDELSSELYVAIADVSAYIKEGSELDKEAKKRSFSVYLPHKVLPMIPFELSNDLCSLVPNKPRASFVVKMKLDKKKKKVLSSEFFEATIISKNRYSYDQIDEIIKANDTDNYFVKLYRLTQLYRKARLVNGFDFRSSETRLKLDKEHNLISTATESSTPSHSLIEECMLLANCEAAKRLKNYGIFRVHEAPSTSNINKLIEQLSLLGIKATLKLDIHKTIQSIQSKAKEKGLLEEVDELIIQSQQQAFYGSKLQGHFGLGFSHYSHFTSPIRRYADLVLHRILKTKKIPKDIDEICSFISDKERLITSLVWDFEDRKYARWADKHIDESFKAKIIDIDNYIAVIEENNISGVRVRLLNYSGEKLFSKVILKITKVNVTSKEILAKIC